MSRSITIHLILYFLGFILLNARGAAQVVITGPNEGEISPFRNQAVIGNAPANLPVRLDINGVPVDSGKVMPNGVFEFLGVPTPEGPVTYRVSVRFPNGLMFAAERHIHVLGSPDSIVVFMTSNHVVGDGKSIHNVTAYVLDKWKVRIPQGYFVTVNADSLVIDGVDADPNAPGFQARLIDGKIAFGLKANHHVGPAVLRLTTNGIARQLRLYVVRPRIPFMIVGSADATGRYQDMKGSAENLPHDDDLTKGAHANGRVAGIAKGTILDDYLLTLSVDSDRKLQDQIYRDLDPKSLYAMYGDNSIVTYEAQSTSPVFAKVERDRSYVMYGDYNSLITRNEFSGYNRSFTGGKLHIEQDRYALDLFGTVTNRKVVQEEIRGQGISGYYYLLQNNLVTGSEKVRIEVRDRFHSEIVVTRKEKARYSDYEIDYVQGSLYFKQPIASLDEQNNPVYIVVSYEATTSAATNAVAGGAASVTLMNSVTLGGTAVIEQRTPKNYTLLGGNLGWQVKSVGSLQAEVARSDENSGNGSAWKVEGDISPDKRFSLRPYYRKVDASFINPTQSGSGRELGTTKYGAALETEPIGGSKLGGEYYEQHQSSGSLSTDVQAWSAFAKQDLGKSGEVSAKIEDTHYDGVNPEAPTQNLNTHSTLLTGSTRVTIVNGLRANAGYEHNVRSADRQVRPNAGILGLEYDVTSAVTLWFQQKFLAQDGHLTMAGVTTKLDEQTSVYGRYEMGSSIAGERNAATIGLKNSWKVTKALTSNILLERTRNLSKNLVEAQTPDHDALSVAFEYLPSFPLKATVKGEYSKDNTSTRRTADVGASYRIFNDFSLLGKATYFVSDASLLPGQVSQSDAMLGFAYRPVNSDWLNLIGKVEFKSQENGSVIPTSGYSATIAAMHVYLEPVRRWELGIKYALKHSRDEYDGFAVSTLSDFILVRPQYDITQVWNVAGECRALWQHTAHDLKVGYSLETGCVVMKNTMISIGYNFQAYKERDLVEYAYTISGPYATLRLKFTEELFGLGDR